MLFTPALPTGGPVSAVTAPDGGPAWMAANYETAATVLADPRFGVEPPGASEADNHTLFRDGAAHRRLRALVSRAFTPGRVAALAPRARELAESAVAAMVATGPPADLVADLAAPLSATVIAELLGVRIDDRAEFRRFADGALMADPGDRAALVSGWETFTAYAAELVEARRSEPGEDLLSGLIAVRDAEEGRLSEDELVGMVVVLVGAGYVSSRNAIAVGAVHLTGRLDTVDEQVVEEALRLASGLTGDPMPRWAREEVELGGVTIAAGDRVLVSLAAANRDPAAFADPDAFRPGRPPHLAFGRGPHHCLGAAVARLELQAALTALTALTRGLPGLRLAVPPEEIPWTHGHVDSGPSALPVTW
jgi:cytochrome P450